MCCCSMSDAGTKHQAHISLTHFHAHISWQHASSHVDRACELRWLTHTIAQGHALSKGIKEPHPEVFW